jgi:hypothetical protein
MVPQQFVDFLNREAVELYNVGLRAKCDRHKGTGFFSTADVCDEPCLVNAVHAAPVGVREEMRA